MTDRERPRCSHRGCGNLILRAGHAPEDGESVDLDGYRFEVLARDGSRVARLSIRRLEPEEDGDVEPGDRGRQDEKGDRE